MQSGVFPCFKLTDEETRETVGSHHIALPTYHPLAGNDLHRTQLILIKIVRIDLFHRKCRITISTPTTAKVEFVVDASDAVVATESQPQSIVLTIGRVGEFNLTEYRRKESTRCSKPIDAKSIIRTIFDCPFAMTD